jgi:hypothetical protein
MKIKRICDECRNSIQSDVKSYNSNATLNIKLTAKPCRNMLGTEYCKHRFYKDMVKYMEECLLRLGRHED